MKSLKRLRKENYGAAAVEYAALVAALSVTMMLGIASFTEGTYQTAQIVESALYGSESPEALNQMFEGGGTIEGGLAGEERNGDRSEDSEVLGDP
jgi:Flp pilus assembly pilin Flp